MHNPYIVGGWVKGANFYGYQALLNDLLDSEEDALWVIGNRRGGKTSLLRHLEEIASSDARYAPLYWNLEGTDTYKGLTEELAYAVEDASYRMEWPDIDPNSFMGKDIRTALRSLTRHAQGKGQKLLLLIDEPEALIALARRAPKSIARLRKTLQSTSGLRTVLVSTRLLLQINEITFKLLTSPFLAGFSPRIMGALTQQEAEDLVHQTHMLKQIYAAPETMDAIHKGTGNQPYLIQYLCFHLFQPDGSLRHPGEPDFIPNDIIAESFSLNWRCMSPNERKVLLLVADREPATLEEMARSSAVEWPVLYAHVYGLLRQEYLTLEKGRFRLQNAFLRIWILANRDELEKTSEALVTDTATSALIHSLGSREVAALQNRLMGAQKNLHKLQEQKAVYGADVPLHILNQIEELEKEIKEVTESLERLEELTPEAREVLETVMGDRK